MASDEFLRRHALCQIFIAGRDVTNKIDPYLITVTVIDTLDGFDKAHIELDDRDARMDIPGDDDPIAIYLGWANFGPRVQPVSALLGDLGTENELPFGGGNTVLVFSGKLSGVESGFSRKGGGRRLWIEAMGGDPKGDGKTGNLSIFGDGTQNIPFSSVVEELGKSAGYNVKVGSGMGKLERPSWFMGRAESFQNWVARTAKEMGGVVKFSGGDTVSITSATDFMNADGQEMPTIEATWGTNLIAWRIKPFVARPQYGKSSTSWFNVFQGATQSKDFSIGGSGVLGGADAVTRGPNPAPNKQVGEQWVQGPAADSHVERGTGWVQINGEPMARSKGKIVISGARPGVDGVWLIKEAEHTYSRKTGYTTRCDVGNPNFLTGPGFGGRGGADDNPEVKGDPLQGT